MPNESAAGQTANTTGGTQTPTFTADEVSALVEKAVQGHLNGIHAKISRLEKGSGSTTTTGTTQTAGEGDDPKAAATLRERVALIEKKTATADRLLRTAGLQSAATAAGVPAERTEAFKTLFEKEYGKGIRVDEETGQLTYVNELNEVSTLADLAKQYVAKAGVGEMFRPPVKVPSGQSLRGGGRSTPANRPTLFDMVQSDPEAYAKLSPEQRSRMAAEDRAAAKQS